MKLSEVASLCQGQLVGADAQVNAISIDTRTLSEGSVYVALRGEHHDGHRFVTDALNMGAVGVLVDRELPGVSSQVVAEDTRLALGRLAANYRQQFPLSVIALTGSCGKTTVKEMIAAILRQAGPTLATQGNLNNDIGVPLMLLKLTAEHQYAVFELGASHANEIAYTVAMVKPMVSLITNVAPAHTEGFGGVDGVAKAKAEIYQGLMPGSIAVINADDAYAKDFHQAAKDHQQVTFSAHKPADVTGRIIATDDAGCISLRLCHDQEAIDIHLSLPGQHQLNNALAAAAATRQLGLSLATIKKGLEAVVGVSGRLRVSIGKQQARIIDDTYNANPLSVKVALEYLASFSGQRIAVLADMLELGDKALQYHYDIGVLAKSLGIDKLYTFGELSRQTSKGFASGGLHFDCQETLVHALHDSLSADTSILVKGSRSMKMENIVTALEG